MQDASWLPKSNKASLLPTIIAPLNSLKDYPETGRAGPDLGVLAAAQLLPGNRETRDGPSGNNRRVREAAGRVLVLSLLLSDPGPFALSLGLSSLTCAMKGAGLKSGFRLCLQQPWSPTGEFLGPVLGGGAAEGRQDRETWDPTPVSQNGPA